MSAEKIRVSFLLLLICGLSLAADDGPSDSNLEIKPDGSFDFEYSNHDRGAHYHEAHGLRNKVVRGRFGSRNPSNGRVEETVYSAGPRGFRARGPTIARKMSLSQVPRGPIGRPGDPYFDPNEDPSYEFGFRTNTYQRKEEADSTGQVNGRYSYIDDVGERHTVQYTAGKNTGFHVSSLYPDSNPNSPNYLYYGGPLRRGEKKPRGKTSVQRNLDGSYRFISGGPDQRRTESKDPFGNVRGSYTYLDDKGVQRTVHYIAGPGIGYRVLKKSEAPQYPFYPLSPFNPFKNEFNANTNEKDDTFNSDKKNPGDSLGGSAINTDSLNTAATVFPKPPQQSGGAVGEGGDDGSYDSNKYGDKDNDGNGGFGSDGGFGDDDDETSDDGGSGKPSLGRPGRPAGSRPNNGRPSSGRPTDARPVSGGRPGSSGRPGSGGRPAGGQSTDTAAGSDNLGGEGRPDTGSSASGVPNKHKPGTSDSGDGNISGGGFGGGGTAPGNAIDGFDDAGNGNDLPGAIGISNKPFVDSGSDGDDDIFGGDKDDQDSDGPGSSVSANKPTKKPSDYDYDYFGGFDSGKKPKCTGKCPTIFRNVGDRWIGFPPGVAVRAHVQSIDLIPIGSNPLPKEAIEKIDKASK